jgi:oligosaccharide repeat unit polymerase
VTTRLVFLDANQQVRVNGCLVLSIAGILYFLSGFIYAEAAYGAGGSIGGLVAIATLGFLGGVLFGRQIGRIQPIDVLPKPVFRRSQTWANRSEVVLILVAFALLLLGCSFYFLAPSGYLSMDKIERSPALRELYGVRILFFMSPVIYYLALMRCAVVENALLRKVYLLYLMLYCAVTFVEINREMLLVLGVLALCWLGRFRKYFPPFFPRQLILIVLVLVLFFTLKGLLYPIFFATTYEGGLLSFGEVINWARWTVYAFDNGIDIEQLHRNDWRYLANALVFPFSAHESASAIWFREVLQMESVGQTYGYSGILSWYSLGGWVGVLMFPALLGFVSVILDRRASPLAALATFCLVLVSFRFFRSEYVLVIKTYLWQFFYPGLLFLFLSRLRVQFKAASGYSPRART